MPHSAPTAQCHSAAILSERIDAIIALIPDDFPGKDATVRALKGRQNSIKFTAPAAVGDRWMQVARILLEKIPNPETMEWAGKILKLFSAEY